MLFFVYVCYRMFVCVFSKLKQVESDPIRLHVLTGEWFNEQRAKRYRNRGADVVQTSIRRKKKDKGHLLSQCPFTSEKLSKYGQYGQNMAVCLFKCYIYEYFILCSALYLFVPPFTMFDKLTMFSYCVDLPVMSVFKEQNEHNSSQRQEEPIELTRADLEDEDIIEKETKIKEAKKER